MPANRTSDLPINAFLCASKRRFSGAHRSAALAFPKNDVRLRSEFQVGIHEPTDFPIEIDLAKKVLAAASLSSCSAPTDTLPLAKKSPCFWRKAAFTPRKRS